MTKQLPFKQFEYKLKADIMDKELNEDGIEPIIISNYNSYKKTHGNIEAIPDSKLP